MTNTADSYIQGLLDKYFENSNHKNAIHGKFTFAQNMIEIGSDQEVIGKLEYDIKDKVWKWIIFFGKPQKPEDKKRA